MRSGEHRGQGLTRPGQSKGTCRWPQHFPYLADFRWTFEKCQHRESVKLLEMLSEKLLAKSSRSG